MNKISVLIDLVFMVPLEYARQALLAAVATTNVLGTKQDLTMVQASSPLMTLSLTCLVLDTFFTNPMYSFCPVQDISTEQVMILSENLNNMQ